MAGRTVKLRPSIGAEILPWGVPYAERFRMGLDAGYEGYEVRSVTSREEMDEIRDAARATGAVLHSVKTPSGRHPTLGTSNAHESARALEETRVALECARHWGAESVLVMAGNTDAMTSHEQAWARSQELIRRELLPIAEEYRIVLAVENVTTGFLMGAPEYARYVDELDSPWVRACPDVGNVMFGNPEHWIRTMGKRTLKLHLKDFTLKMENHRYSPNGSFGFRNIGEGNIDWVAVSDALAELEFSGWATYAPIVRLSTRVVERGVREVRRTGLTALPGIGATTNAIQEAAARRWLRRQVNEITQLNRA